MAKWTGKLLPLIEIDAFTFVNDSVAKGSWAFSSFKVLMCPSKEFGCVYGTFNDNHPHEPFWCGEDRESALCQIGPFNRINDDSDHHQPVNPDGTITEVSMATLPATEGVSCNESYYQNKHYFSDKHQDRASNGDVWSIVQVHQRILPRRQEAVLLLQAAAFLDAAAQIKDMLYIPDVRLKGGLCLKQDGTLADTCQKNQRTSFYNFMNTTMRQVLSQTAGEANATQDVQLAMRYICQRGLTGRPDSALNITDSGHNFEITVDVRHECCCKDADDTCRNGYAILKT